MLFTNFLFYNWIEFIATSAIDQEISNLNEIFLLNTKKYIQKLTTYLQHMFDDCLCCFTLWEKPE